MTAARVHVTERYRAKLRLADLDCRTYNGLRGRGALYAAGMRGPMPTEIITESREKMHTRKQMKTAAKKALKQHYFLFLLLFHQLSIEQSYQELTVLHPRIQFQKPALPQLQH